MCEVCQALSQRESRYSGGYIPVPVWNGSEWEPLCLALGEKPMCWPEGFSTEGMPIPNFQLGDIVTFSWQGPNPWRGYIERIKLHGGGYDSYEGTALEVCAFRYRRPFMTYTIRSRGHGRWVYERNIIEKVGQVQGFFK